MATVWAARVGVWLEAAYRHGWSHTIQFDALSDLNGKMQAKGLQGKVTRLGVVAHGDRPGQVQLDRLMTVHSLAAFRSDLERLRWFLTKDAQLVFYSCIAGKASEGDRFLMKLSSVLEGRTVIGFTMYGETHAAAGLKGTPGVVYMRQSALARSERPIVLTIQHPAAKWARNGTIIRNSPLERGAKKRCAKPGCPGHSDARHRCP